MSVRHAILGLLREESKHGYQIRQELERALGGDRVNSAQVYQGLRWIEERGWVSSAPVQSLGGRERINFRITPLGVVEFDRWLEGPLPLARPQRDSALLQVIFLGQRDPAGLRRQLDSLRARHLRRLAALRLAAKSEGEPTLALDLGAAALRFREEAEVGWIDYCLDRLETFEKKRPERVNGDEVADRDPLSRAGRAR